MAVDKKKPPPKPVAKKAVAPAKPAAQTKAPSGGKTPTPWWVWVIMAVVLVVIFSCAMLFMK